MTIRTLDIAKATGPLSEYAHAAGEGPIVVTEAGRPVAVVVAVEDADLETVSLSENPDFIAMIERSRARYHAEGGLTADEVRRRLGLTAAAPASPPRS